MQFALWEAKTLIPMLYHNFTFKLVDKFKLYPSRYVAMIICNQFISGAGPPTELKPLMIHSVIYHRSFSLYCTRIHMRS